MSGPALRQRLWSTRPPDRGEYDVIVIGSGLGGLMCGLHLAVQGLHVAVLEAHSHPGGYAHVFRRAGYLFDVSLHHIGGLGAAEQPVARLLASTGVLDAISPRQRARAMTVDVAGDSLAIPNGSAQAQAALCDRFPRQADRIERFWQLLAQVRGALFSGTGANAGHHALWADGMGEMFSDVRLASVLGQTWMYLGLPPSMAGWVSWCDVMSSILLDGGSALAPGELTRAICQRFMMVGGDLYTNSRVARIVIEGGRTAGVELGTGALVRARAIVSNADPVQTFQRLLPESATTAVFRRRVAEQPPSLSAWVTYVGLDCAPSAIGIPFGPSFYASCSDLEASYQRAMQADPRRTDWGTTSDEDRGPSAGHCVSFTELTPGARWIEMPAEEYPAEKAAVAARLWEKYNQRFPGLAAHARVVEFATPRTMNRYCLNHAGAIYGAAQSPTSRRLANRSPVPGLFLTGAWTRPGGSYEAVLVSGTRCADAVLSDQAVRSGRRAVSVPVTPVSHARPSAGRWENADDHFDVIFQDTDATGAVFHGAYMHFLELARNRWLARTAGSTGCARLEVWSMHVRFLHAARLHDRLSVSLRARRASAHELVILQRLTCDGRMLVEAHAQVACFDGAGQPCPGPISAQPFESARWLTSTVNTGTRWIAEYAERAFDREVDARGFLSVEGAVRIFERARTAAIHELLGASLQLDRMRVYEIQLERRAEIRVGEDLTVRTGPGASTVFRADVIHELCGSDGETALSATVGIVCVDDRAQLIPLPSEVRAAHTLAVNRSK